MPIMPNPNPVQSQEFKDKQFHAYGDEKVPLAKKITALRLPQDVWEALEGLPAEDRVIYLRRVISDTVRKDLIE